MGTYCLHLLSYPNNLIIFDMNKNIYWETTMFYAQMFPCLSIYLTQNTPGNHGNCIWLPQYLHHRNCTNGYCNKLVTKKEMKEQRMNEPRSYIYGDFYDISSDLSKSDWPSSNTDIRKQIKNTRNFVTQVLTQSAYCSHMIPMPNEWKKWQSKNADAEWTYVLERATDNDSSLFSKLTQLYEQVKHPAYVIVMFVPWTNTN